MQRFKVLLKRILIAVILGVLAAAAFAIVSAGGVTINIVNKSGKDIATVDLIHNIKHFGDGKITKEKVPYRISGLAVGKTKKIRLRVPTESSYEMVVMFKDGKQISGGQGYIEPGYKIIETVESDKISSQVKLRAF